MRSTWLERISRASRVGSTPRSPPAHSERAAQVPAEGAESPAVLAQRTDMTACSIFMRVAGERSFGLDSETEALLLDTILIVPCLDARGQSMSTSLLRRWASTLEASPGVVEAVEDALHALATLNEESAPGSRETAQISGRVRDLSAYLRHLSVGVALATDAHQRAGRVFDAAYRRAPDIASIAGDATRQLACRDVSMNLRACTEIFAWPRAHSIAPAWLDWLFEYVAPHTPVCNAYREVLFACFAEVGGAELPTPQAKILHSVLARFDGCQSRFQDGLDLHHAARRLSRPLAYELIAGDPRSEGDVSDAAQTAIAFEAGLRSLGTAHVLHDEAARTELGQVWAAVVEPKLPRAEQAKAARQTICRRLPEVFERTFERSFDSTVLDLFA